MCSPCKVCGDHAKRHAASATHPMRGGEENMKEKMELVMNELAGTDEGICNKGGIKEYVEEDSDYGMVSAAEAVGEALL